MTLRLLREVTKNVGSAVRTTPFEIAWGGLHGGPYAWYRLPNLHEPLDVEEDDEEH